MEPFCLQYPALACFGKQDKSSISAVHRVSFHPARAGKPKRTGIKLQVGYCLLTRPFILMWQRGTVYPRGNRVVAAYSHRRRSTYLG